MSYTTKKVNLKLVGINGNAYSVMGAFQHQARREGWSKDEIDEVIKKCTSGDYNNLLRVICDHCVDPLCSDSEDNDPYDKDEQKWAADL